MPRVTHVKSARFDNRVCKKGESYYWWKPFRSGKHYSLTYPKPSQLCSGRKSEVMATQENLEAAMSGCGLVAEDVRSACEDAAGEFRQQGEEYCEGADNMPESLQYGEQAEGMREMGASLEEAADSLENLDFDPPDEFEDDEPEEPQAGEFDSDDDYEDAVNEFDMAHEQWEADKAEAESARDDFVTDLIDEANEAAGRILTGYLEEKLNVSMTGQTQTGLARMLTERGVEPALSERVQICLMLSETGRYAPTGINAGNSNLLSETEQVITELDKELSRG